MLRQRTNSISKFGPPWLIFFVALFSMLSCAKHESPGAATSIQARAFSSPDAASDALFQAAKSGDQNSLLAIFGSDAKDVLLTGDSLKDQKHMESFVTAYEQMHRWANLRAGGKVLYLGAVNFPFPIPLAQNSSGQWGFDVAAGKDEMLARRIGKNEIAAITACDAGADAEKQYFSKTHDGSTVKQFAQKIVSDPGKQNGLYWPNEAGGPESPLGQVPEFAEALASPSTGDTPGSFDGYYFRILKKQGPGANGGAEDYVVNGNMTRGFAILAYPVEYRNTGVMTFLVGSDGVVYQSDLGEKTAELGAAMTDYDPAKGWNPVI
jgi:Protein of unknown function (DUF2950)